jgi:hypothetical protein
MGGYTELPGPSIEPNLLESKLLNIWLGKSMDVGDGTFLIEWDYCGLTSNTTTLKFSKPIR